MLLSDIERDALIEVFNIGMGRAAGSLSELLHEEIYLTTPSLDVLPLPDAVRRLGGGRERTITGVMQYFNGPFKGQAMLLFPDGCSLELVRLITEQFMPLEAMTELEQETLTEVGNIMINACLASLAEVFGETIHSEIPTFAHETYTELMNVDRATESIVLLLQLEFRLESHDLRGFMLFMVDIESLHTFRQLIGAQLLCVSGF